MNIWFAAMQRFEAPEKRLRGIQRRLRALKKWAENFAGNYPYGESMDPANRYWNWKMPVHVSLVEGHQTNLAIQKECAQRLIDACGNLIASKLDYAKGFRTTSVVCLPDMFTSEVCIYLDEAYFREHTGEAENSYGKTRRLVERSLVKEWGLVLPVGVAELGISVDYRSERDDWSLVGERWYFGEVL